MEYLQGSDAALILNVDTTPAVVQGMQSISLPGKERNIVDLNELRNDFARQFAGGMKTTPINIKANFLPGDTAGQKVLSEYLDDKTVFTNGRIALNDEVLYDFYGPDLANDPAANGNGWQVTKYAPGECSNDRMIEVDVTITLGGKVGLYNVHTSASMTVTKGTGSDEDTIARAAGSFVTDGWVAGMCGQFEKPCAGAGANAGAHFLVLTVEATTLTLTTIGSTTAVSSAADIIIHGGY